MATNHNFELVYERTIPELNTKARLFRHKPTGAELLSMENKDENKCFGVTFATPPDDSDGLPHILEHSVLGGSQKYPVKEPFVELIKGSLATFVNAMTYPDKTTYPVASQNVKDFYNLIDVYMDAVYHPTITEQTLRQEGWHFELENPDDPLNYRGIVFNEMKGAYSSPDSLLGRYTQQSLFPGHTYGVDSGGDPKIIPNLTYKKFRKFWETYYHPSNARFYFYGDDNAEERLRLLDGYLQGYKRLDVKADIPLLPRFDEPHRQSFPYAAGKEDAERKKGMLNVSWAMSDVKDIPTTLALNVLDYILVGTPASPLRKALIDSGLGEDITGGMEDELRQVIFSAGLKGISTDNAGKVEKLILDTLARLTKDGIERDMIDAALNTIEFRLRENNTGQFPQGLLLMLKALTTWLHGGDPVGPLAFEAPLNALKARLVAGEKVFEGLIKQYMLDNPHRSTVVLEPDPALNQRDEAAEKERLAKARAKMKPADVQAVVENTKKLREMQDAPNSPEALATLPILKLSDLDRKNKTIPLRLDLKGSQVLYHDLFTNGLLYLDVGFDLRALAQEYLPLVTPFGRALLEMGTATEDFVRLSQRIGRKTGGIQPANYTSAARGSARGATWLLLRGKSTVAQIDDLLAILRDVLLTVKLDNRERFRQIVLEEKARQESRLVPAGHLVALTRLKASFTEADWAAEQIGGVTYLFALRLLAEQIEKDWPAVLAKLEAMRKALLNRSTMLHNVTIDEKNWGAVQPKLASFIESLPQAAPARVQWKPQRSPANEGMTIPAQVNYVAKGTSLYEHGYKLHGSVEAITNYLGTTWLWDRIRARGGAYGGFCVFNQRSGVFSYLSYRDPNLLGTLDNYDGTVQFLRELKLTEDELTKAIIGAIGNLDAFQLPDAKGFTSMARYLTGETEAELQKFRDEILSMGEASFKAFADALEQVNQHGLITVLGSEEAIRKANTARGNFLQVTKVL
jgi:Zn-dependent M16 (insulinase) family peptidase